MNESHDCTRFESSLLDLVYGEIPVAEAEELRHHAAKCRQCRTTLEETMLTRKRAAQLPLLEPNSEIDATILDAAKKRAAELAGLGDAEGVKNRGAHGDIWLKHPTFGERLRSFLLARPSPQPRLPVSCSFSAFFYRTSETQSTKHRNQPGRPLPRHLSRPSGKLSPVPKTKSTPRIHFHLLRLQNLEQVPPSGGDRQKIRRRA